MKTSTSEYHRADGSVSFTLQILFVLLILFVVMMEKSAQAAAYPYEITPATSIPNPATNVCSYTNINITVSDSFTITDLNVGLNITHTNRADIDAKLTSPTGTSIFLFTDVGGAGDHFDILLDDSHTNDIGASIGTTNHTLAAPYYDKLYNPEGTAVLSNFNGQNANGTWVLGICDDASATSGGIVNRVKLDFSGTPITGSISGTLYTDSNANNALDAAETKLPNVTVWLYDSAGTNLLQTKTTDTNGAYSFTSVAAGNYQVKVDTADTDLPSGSSIGTTHPLTAVAVTAGNTTANQNFGFDIISIPANTDYGDAPDTANGTATGNYQTKHSDNGPRHTIIPNLLIGSQVDADNGTLQNAAADADDTNASPDDEDGLINAPIIPAIAGQSYALPVYVKNETNTTAYLTAYIDFNRDGDFLDTGEQSDTKYVYWNGYFYPTLTLPTGITAGNVYARLRLSQTQAEAESSVGAATSGEVEDHLLTVSSGALYDFGDAPASYGIARHTINNSIHLGINRPDAESASLHSYNAFGDGYDEDGAPHQTQNTAITLFPILKMTASSYSVDFRVTNTSGSAATLTGWIDFDQNGSFQADEAASVSVPNPTSDGTATLNWSSIPTDIKLGTTFIRLRLTTDGTVTTSTPSNNASNGEVEDYPIAVAMDIPPDSPNVTIVRGEAPACSSTVFTDNFNSAPVDQYFGQHTSATPYVITNWTATGGGGDTYARTVTNSAQFPTQGTSIYFGNGFIRRIYPDIGVTPAFDANGRMLSPPDAIELRDNIDDTTPSATGSGESDWGPEPVKLSRTFATTAGQKYRLYFSALPEDAGSAYYASGIMRVDTPSGSVHFKAPGGMEGIQKYRIEFTATGASSTISFVNYGHIGTDGGWCDPNSIISGAWCSVGGSPTNQNGNELIIDDVTVALASACPTSGISGSVYVDKNANNAFDTANESGLGNISVTLYDNNGTTATTTDDISVATVSTAANGAYNFANISSAPHYRIEVDSRDNDLPASAVIGTTNPLADVTVTSGSTLANQNFGFDLACDASAGQFGGIVFRDYNQNGVRESQEEGIAGVTVTAYNSANASVATATTDARGWYTLSGLSNGTQYRLEYTGLAAGLASGIHGTESFTNMRFITASSSCAANYGVSDPVEYCQATPYVAANVYVNGDPTVADVGNYTSIHAFPYTATGPAYAETPPASAKASTSQTGALWGMAYQKSSKTLFASAAMRRFSGLGSLGTGGIYKINMTDPTANTGASAYIDVRTIGIPTGNDVRNAADSCNNLASSPWTPAHDVAAWDAVGKVGIGGIDHDGTNNRLWLVNLNDRKLYGISNISPTTTPTAANVLGGYAINLPSPYSCTSGTFRPWAVKYHRGYVYVGGVCDAASAPYTLSNVRGYVLRFDPANTAAGFSYVKDFPINQPRARYAYNTPAEWNGWIPQADAVGWPYFHSPIVGDLEFDTDGSIIVGVIDRAGLQNGNSSYDEPSCTDTGADYTDALGDVLRLCKTDSGYLTDNEPGCTTSIPLNSKTTDEYYWGDMGPTANAWENMNEIASGGLALAPGQEHVLISSYDTNSWGSNGIAWLNNKTGAADNRYYVSWTTFGKSTGMGELEVLCDPAPIEVGNRVWLDTDKDGIQDAGEAGISNVNVALVCGADSVSATTNTSGEYYFSNAAGGNATFMGSGESCSLSINNSQVSLTGYTLTTQNADSKTDNNYQTDIRDSDAAIAGGNASISFTVGSSGQNNHSLDFGYKSASSPGTVSGTVYLDANKNAAFDAGETGITNITVSLYDENATAGDLNDDTLVNTATTNASGAYSFTNVDASRTYRAAADTTDPDLPANTHSTTTNPLTAITVTTGGTTANKNFGFGQVVAACSPPSPTTTGINSSITWNHNPFTPASQATGGHPVPAILNTGLIASAANEVRSNLTTGATDWEMYAETASVPATLAEAISSNKYFGYSFTTQASLSNSHLLYGVALSTLGPNNTWNHSGKYKVHIRLDDNAAFASPAVVKNLIQIDEDNPTTGGDVSEGPLYGSDFYISHYDFDTPANLEANKTYYLRFYVYDDTKAGVANSVPGRIIFDDLLLKTLDCGAAPSTLLSVSDAVVTEGNSGLSYLNFPVQLSAAAPTGGVSFNYATADGTATLANSDYQSKTGTLTIPMGANGSVISVPVVGDTNVEPNEKISLNISNVVNAQFNDYPLPPQGSIIDDDAVVACNASSGDFGGIVFQDYNQNGTRESGEIGLAGITVTAYNSSNAAAATATTDTGGWYKLTGLTNGTQYRLEFTGLPSGTELGAAGSASATNVQFVTVSATCNANLGVYNPVDYCQADPKLLATRYINGDTSVSSAGMAGTFGALLSYQYSASGIAPTLNQDALASQVGSVWGLAYNRHTKKAFASAMVRRHVGLGPLGIGGLYVINYAGASPVVSSFLNLDGLAGIDVGSIGSNSARSLPGDPYLPNHDPTAFDKTGKEGLGDVELSDDGNTLYVSNLYSRKIIKVDLTAYNTSGTVPTTATEISLPALSCTNGVARPFALKYYRGKLHAGITCTGENGGSSADLKASIQAYDGTSWTEKLQVPLNYQTWHADHMRASEYSRSNIPWVSSMSALTFGDHGSLDWADDSQLLLSGIEFDSNGDMLLGFIDRTGLQFGQYNYGTDTGSTRFYGVFSNGELLKAGYNASTGVYTLENAGSVNGIAGEGAKTGADPAWPYGGPGGGEFYGGEKFVGHTENSFGALAVIPGKQEVALNAMNPFNISTGGTIWLDNNTGSRTRGVQLYGEDNRFFGKAVGLGDIEVLCDPAPTEIGNRVWLDSDSDGLQDAGEAGINNVTVTLTCGTDTATATTNAQGEYYFSNKAGGNATFMGNGESCSLSINNTQASLSTHTLTTQNAGGRSDNDRFADIRDSDAAVNGGNAGINFTVGSSGQNNYGLDFGYKPSNSSSTCDGRSYGIYFNAANNYSAIYEMTDVGTTNSSLSTTLLKSDAFPFKSISLAKGLDNKLYSVHSNALTSGQTAPLYVYNPSTPTVQATNTGISLPYPGKNLWWISGGLDPAGNLYFMLKDGSYLVKINLATSQVTTVWSTWPVTTTKAPGGENFGQLSINVPSSYTLFYDITFDSNGDALITDADGHYVWKITNISSSPTAAYLGSLNGMTSISDPQWINDGGTIRLFGSDANTPDGTHYIDTTTWNTTKIGATSFYDMASCDFSILTPPAISNNISGKVFEDVNYGGGAGRAFGTAGTAGVNGSRVELYSSAGAFISSTNTAADGSYSFGSLAAGNYYVRVVNDTVKSTRTGSNGTERGIQTYRTDGTTANSNEVGGRKPTSVDAAANTTSQTLDPVTFLLSGGGQAQSVQPVTVAAATISGVDFGFNFSTVVNTNDSGQGSLRQGIININLLANTGLAQAGQDNTYGVNPGVIKEVLLFNIPATSDPLGRTDICGSATCKITLNTQLPAVALQPAIIDATTQPGYVAGTPGVPRIHIVPATGLDARGFTMGYDAPDSTLRGFAITGFRNLLTNRGITVDSERTLIESNYIGVKPDGTADGNSNGIELQYTQSAVIGGTTAAKRNIISANSRLGIFFNTGASGSTIQNNFIGTNPAGTASMGNGTTGIDTEGGSGTKILDNVIAGNPYQGIELGFTSGGPGTANAIIQGNRIGVGINGEAIGNGTGIINYGVSNGHTIGGTGAGQANIIAHNLSGGISFYNNGSSGITISANSIYANGGLGIDLGFNGITVNDANDADAGANNLLNFPLLSNISISGSNLVIKGCAPASATVELFEADVSVGGKATPGANKFSKSKDYGEGQTYLSSFVEGSAADTDSSDCTLAVDADGNDQTGMKTFSVTIPAPTGFVEGDTMTATATLAASGTSEFSPAIVLQPPSPPLACSILDALDNATVEEVTLTSASPGPVTRTWTANIDGLIGGARTLTVGPATNATVTNGYGLLDVANSAASSSPLKLCYDANGAGLNINLSQTDNIQFKILEDEHHNPNAATRANIPMTVTLSDGSNSASLTQNMVDLIFQQRGTSPGWADIRFPLSGFTGMASVNRNTIQSICIDVAGKNGHDYALEKITLEDNETCTNIAGRVFEDVNYGGGAGRPFGTAGTAGINGATLELYDANGTILERANSYPHTTDGAGTYTFPALKAGNYYVRAVSDTVGSSRSGATGSELGIMTYRTAGTPATTATNEVGGRKPALEDPASNYDATLNTGTFLFSGGSMDGLPAQAVQPVTLAGSHLSDVSFGFNFSTVVNANDSGQGSLRQFLLNANLLSGESTLAQVGRTAGRENAILMLPTTDPNYNAADKYWSIALQSALPALGNSITLDGSIQAGFTSYPPLELNGSGAGAGTNGLILNGQNTGSEVKNLAINRFSGAGIQITQSQNNVVAANHIGLDPTGTVARGNSGNGIIVTTPLGNNVIGGTAAQGNKIAYNGADGINASGSDGRIALITGNSIYANGKLGIDLGNNGITLNDANDVDTGINKLLNFPLLSEITTSGGNMTVKGCAPAGATVELFEADVSPGGAATPAANKFGKSKDYGEGQTYLASFVEGSASDTDAANCALATDADSNDQTGMKAFSVTIPKPGSVVEGDILTTTATLAAVGTSEFSPAYTFNTACSLVVTITADSNNASNNSGSLRDAIECANSTPAADTISFNIPASQPGYTNPDGIANNGDEYWSIQPTTPLPGITQPLTIDGSTQPGTTCPQPRVEIDGSSAGADADGIGLYASNSIIKGLIINDFSRYGIRLSRFPITFPVGNTLQTNNTVQCSYIGVSASGLVAKPNLQGGIAAEGDSMKIGGTTTVNRNIISGNGEFGIYFYGGGSTNGTVQGNYIGVGANGTTALGNQGFGIGYYNTDGGGLIGGTVGVTVNGACTGTCNLIAHNTSAGIGFFYTGPAGRNVRISGNAVHSNGGIGIDLERSSSPWVLDGVNPNDTGDSDSAFAPNALQNYPMLTSAAINTTTTDVTGTLNSIANTTFTLEFFANTSSDPSGYGEGERYLGNTTITTNASGDANFTVPLPIVTQGTYITSTATDTNNNTSEFSSAIIATVTKDISGKVFEDVNYGGGNGRAFNAAAGMAGISGATVELRTTANALVTSTTTAADGGYIFTNIPVGSYSVQVVADSVNSTRSGSNGTELGVMTYRTDGTAAGEATNGVGGQAVQPVTVATTNLSGVDFGFNFDTVSNTNDSGAGSLRQFIINANQLGGDATLAQQGRTAGKENAILQLPLTDATYISSGYWSIALQSALPDITSPVILDGSLPAGSNTNPVLELKGTTAGASTHGLTLNAGAAGSTIRKLTINRFGGAGIYLNGGGNNTLQANHIGLDPAGTTARANSGAGIRLDASSNNLIGGASSNTGNLIANNGGDGIAVTGATAAANTILGNSIHSNGGLGIDLADNGVTNNDSNDADTGPNNLLNFPDVQVNSFGSNGTKIITYDFDLDVPAGDYRLEFFVSITKDPSGNGEGQIFLGSKDISHPGTGSLNFKGTFNANQSMPTGVPIATTLTRKTAGGFAETSEFSGIKDGIPTQVCDSLTTGTGTDTMMIDENSTVIKLLEAKDSSGNPITYVISGGADKNMFAVTNPTTGATLDCATVKFISSGIVITKAVSATDAEDAETRAIVPPGYLPPPGNFELPLDSNKDNVYDFQMTATYANGQKVIRDMSIRVMDTNEAPTITSAAAVSFNEDSSANVLDIASQDPDAGTSENNGLTYSITAGADAKLFEVAPATGILRFRAAPDYDAPMDTNRDNLYEVEVTVTDKGGLTASKLFKVSVNNNAADDGVLLNVKTLLQGAYDGNSGLMSNDLATLGLLPGKQPYKAAPFSYNGTETVSTLVLEATGNNAIVDWALVDLRSSTSTIVASRALMLQRDGDLVDAQTGSADLHFANVKAGNYYVSVRHRNHLDIISASPISLSNSTKLVNFASSTTVVKGDEARLTAGKVAMMWAGDINGSNTLTANGPGNDVTSLLSGVITSMDNVQGNTNYIMRGYLTTDLNMDGKTLFTGPGNDASLLVGNIILHPLNTGFAGNYIVKGGLQ